MKEIQARFVRETGTWDYSAATFVERKTQEFTRIISMRIIEGNKPIIQFIGGPTGFEGYLIESLLEKPIQTEEFCICGGTINRWDACYVPMKEVLDYIKKRQKKEE